MRHFSNSTLEFPLLSGLLAAQLQLLWIYISVYIGHLFNLELFCIVQTAWLQTQMHYLVCFIMELELQYKDWCSNSISSAVKDFFKRETTQTETPAEGSRTLSSWGRGTHGTDFIMHLSFGMDLLHCLQGSGVVHISLQNIGILLQQQIVPW